MVIKLQENERVREEERPTKTIKKMAIGKYILIITLNVNGLNASPKDKDWLNGLKNKTYTYAVYKRPTSDLRTLTD